MTVANLYVKCFHGKKLSNTDDISSGSGYAASVGACHLDISRHHTDIHSADLFLSPANTGSSFLNAQLENF